MPKGVYPRKKHSKANGKGGSPFAGRDAELKSLKHSLSRYVNRDVLEHLHRTRDTLNKQSPSGVGIVNNVLYDLDELIDKYQGEAA